MVLRATIFRWVQNLLQPCHLEVCNSRLTVLSSLFIENVPDEPAHEHRKRGQRLQELIAAQQLDENGNLEKKHHPRRARTAKQPKTTSKAMPPNNDEAFSSDGDDSDYSGASSDDSIVSRDGVLSNGEVRPC